MIYTSAKTGKNCDLLLEYIQSFLFQTSFNYPAQTIERESIFIPIGWDSLPKIKSEFILQFDQVFQNILPFPELLKSKSFSGTLIVCEDDEQFLNRLYQIDTEESKSKSNQKTDEFFEQLRKFGSIISSPKTSESQPNSIPPLNSPSSNELGSFFNNILKNSTNSEKKADKE